MKNISMDENSAFRAFVVKGSVSSSAFAENTVEAAHIRAAAIDRITPSMISYHDMPIPCIRDMDYDRRLKLFTALPLPFSIRA